MQMLTTALVPAPYDRRNVPRADVIVRACSCELEGPLSPRSCRCTLGVWGVQSPDDRMGRVTGHGRARLTLRCAGASFLCEAHVLSVIDDALAAPPSQ